MSTKPRISVSNNNNSSSGTEKVFDRLYRLSVKSKPSATDNESMIQSTHVLTRKRPSTGNIIHGRVSNKNLVSQLPSNNGSRKSNMNDMVPIIEYNDNHQSYHHEPHNNSVSNHINKQQSRHNSLSTNTLTSSMSPLLISGYSASHKPCTPPNEQPDEYSQPESINIINTTKMSPIQPLSQLHITQPVLRSSRHTRTVSAAPITRRRAAKQHSTTTSIDINPTVINDMNATARRSTAPTWTLKLNNMMDMSKHYQTKKSSYHSIDESTACSDKHNNYISQRQSIVNTPNKSNTPSRRISVVHNIPANNITNTSHDSDNIPQHSTDTVESIHIQSPVLPVPNKDLSRVSIKPTRLRPRLGRTTVRKSVKPTVAPPLPTQPISSPTPVAECIPVITDKPVVVEHITHYIKQGKKPIGIGAFGVVWCVKHYKSFDRYALKIISKSAAQAKGYSLNELDELVTNELYVLNMRQLNHTVGLMPLISYFTDTDKYYMKFPLCGGDLYQLLAKFGAQSESNARYIIGSVIHGLSVMHQYNVAHRDVKPENIMIGRDGRIYLSDFGTAKLLPTTAPHKLYDMAGTLMYVAPEVVRWNAVTCGLEVEPDGHDINVDCWGIGVVLYLVLTGKLPFHSGDDNDELTLQLIKSAELSFHSISTKLTTEVCDILHCMLQCDPRTRPSMQQLKKHKWFKTFNWTQFESDQMKPPKPLQSHANRLWADIDYMSRKGNPRK